MHEFSGRADDSCGLQVPHAVLALDCMLTWLFKNRHGKTDKRAFSKQSLLLTAQYNVPNKGPDTVCCK